MRTPLSIAALIFIVAIPAATQERDLPYGPLVRALTDEVAVPAYRRMTRGFLNLSRKMESFCAQPNSDELGGVQTAYGIAMDAWQHAQPFAFGPVLEDSRNQRIEFWPDSGGSTARRIRRALAAKDPALVSPGGLDGKSVALQSLSTFERLLHDEEIRHRQGRVIDVYDCALLTAIARFQVGVAQAIEHEWSTPGGFRERILTAEAKSAAQDYFKSLFGVLDGIVLQKLERPLGDFPEKARPERAESWRTARSLANIAANLETARDMFAISGGFADLMRAADLAPLADGMIASFDRTIAKANAIPMPLKDAVTDPATRARVEDLLDEVKALRTLVTGPVAQGIGLIVGFNATDGD